MRPLLLLVSLVTLQAAPRGCVGNVPVGTFQFSVAPKEGGSALPIRVLNRLREGQKLQYKPLQLPSENPDKAQVAIVLLPSEPNGEVIFLEARKAAQPGEWTVPADSSVAALIFGPQGLSVKKLQNLVVKNQDILLELANYAEQSSKVEALVQALDESENGGKSLDAALSGFSAQYGVAMPKLDTHASKDQQAAVLLQALMPTVRTYDPLSPRNAVMQQSAGLATSVAGMFFGSPVGLAAGGVSLVQNLRTLMFPGMEFRSAFAQPSTDGLSLCANKQDKSKARTRLAYLWAYRLPSFPTPAASLTGDVHVPLGAKSILALKGTTKGLERARDWKLGGQPVVAAMGASGLELDLTKTTIAPGQYRLTAAWDWETLEVAGSVYTHPFGDLKTARIETASRDRLAEGNGRLAVALTGPDFEFVERVAVESTAQRQPHPTEVPFTLPLGKRAGEQRRMEVELDANALKSGHFRMLLTQSDGLTYEVPFAILPPYPKLENLPLRANLGDAEQRISLRGTGLDRIEALTCPDATVELQPGTAAAREAVVRLAGSAKKGAVAPLQMKVQGVEKPLEVPQALQVAGPRPRITEVRRSSTGRESGVALRPDELAAGAVAGFALSVRNVEGSPSAEVGCASEDDTRRKLVLAPGDQSGAARLDLAGDGLLFLSLDPGAVGQPGCSLRVQVATEGVGRSDPQALGRIVRIPRIEQFQLTDRKIGEGLYAGTFKGQDLDTIEKVGWDDQDGVPVPSIPAPAPGEPGKQTLEIGLKWPAPSPHAPAYIWLRGETSGRATGVKY